MSAQVQRAAGPKGKFLLGNILEFAQDPPKFMQQLARDYGDVSSLRLGPQEFIHFAHPDLAQEMLVKKAKSFRKLDKDREIMGKAVGGGLLTSEGDFHKQQRALSQPSFRKKRIRLFADAMLEETEKLLATWEDGDEIDINKEMLRLTMHIVTRTLFQVELQDEAEHIGAAIHALQEVANKDFQSAFRLPSWLPTQHNRRHKRERKKVDDFIEKLIEERRRDGDLEDRGDLLSTLIMAEGEDGERMSDEQLRDELVTLFVAGHETTSNALTWTWYLLSQHPEVAQKLHDEVDAVLGGRPVTPEDIPQLPYAVMVIKESMRLFPPAWTLNARVAIEDVEIGGVCYPKGSRIFVMPYVLHRDPRFYHAPEQFDPEHFSPAQEKERHRFAYLPFGAGPRVCIGNAFAMMEATLVLVRLAQRFQLQLQPGQDVQYDALITLVPKDKIMMKINARTPDHDAVAPVVSVSNPNEAGCPFHKAA